MPKMLKIFLIFTSGFSNLYFFVLRPVVHATPFYLKRISQYKNDKSRSLLLSFRRPKMPKNGFNFDISLHSVSYLSLSIGWTSSIKVINDKLSEEVFWNRTLVFYNLQNSHDGPNMPKSASVIVNLSIFFNF